MKYTTPADLLADLRNIVTDPLATPEMRLAAVALAYDIGKSEGHTNGVLEGIQRMHTGAQDALAQVMRPKAAT